MTRPHAERLYFLDWLRILAFFVLVLFHTGMYYVTWDWHVKSRFASDALEPFMLLSSPWRLGLLFLVSGAACACLLDKAAGPGAFFRQRSVRLLVPLVFGMFVVVPLQPYFEVVQKVGYAGSFADFMKLYVTGYGGFCKDGCLLLPTWNHLWFLAYVWTYAVLLALLVHAAGTQRMARWSARLAALLSGWKAIALPAALLALARVLLVARFPSTHALVNDFYNHAHYLPLFLAGALLARQAGFWRELERLRRPALYIAVACWGYLAFYFSAATGSLPEPWFEILRPAQRIAYALCEWSAIAAACGFAHRHLNRERRARAYLARAVMPVYILHQTVIIVLAQAARPLGLAPAVEGPFIVLATFGLCLAAHEAIRRMPALQPLFGLAPASPADAAPRVSPRGAPPRSQSTP